MEEHSSNYVFRPILEPSEDKFSPKSHTSRIRVNSGSAVSDLRNVASPTAAGHGLQRTPKLYSCWRTNPEVWSSAGSRPGSSQASSRPPSQCNNSIQQSNSLYCKSNNSSTSDVSTAQRNFQQLSVSSRRAAFKTQKWSNSFDQTTAQATQNSPGKRRQASLQQQTQHAQKSFDLADSGYSATSSVDLRSWTSGSRQAQQVCVSPIESAKQELEELKSEFPQLRQLPVREEDLTSSRSASLPSFPESFIKNNGEDLNVQGLSEILALDESLDDLDEEIKMIVGRGEGLKDGVLPTTDEVLTVLEQCDAELLKPPPLSRDNSGGSSNDSGHCSGNNTTSSSSNQQQPVNVAQYRRAIFAKHPKGSLDEQRFRRTTEAISATTASLSASQGKVKHH